MAYSDKVIDHYNNPRNVGQLDKSSTEVGTGLVGAPECGDVMRLQIRVNPETQVIEEAKFKTFGCGSAIASSSLATEWIKGRTVEDALAIKNTDIVKELSLPPVKIHCSVLAEDDHATAMLGPDLLVGSGRGTTDCSSPEPRTGIKSGWQAQDCRSGSACISPISAENEHYWHRPVAGHGRTGRHHGTDRRAWRQPCAGAGSVKCSC